ncbi:MULTISPECIES: prepilin peptidase [Thermoanaerobacterium]|uniref:Peptidase A24A prepilin type IV n=2 Tax=Thermoanaerobacterium TaxID=28895 RepID=W9EAV8_9THEO|nr:MULTISPECIES: prepilin peptidase [Thermoanaerobacterium]AFK94255.1 peptidase A24A prepilin type IV [Thermoanaerobacterium saccharolyticum JW/SL-YS485]ETO39167.1 peptidase A24A prepilin type IV [Thermoanaerobacterium aotearoense SCUT27]
MYLMIIILLSVLLIYISYIDFKSRIIPNKIILPAYILSALYNIYLLFTNKTMFYNNIIAFCIAFGFMFIIGLLSKGALGGGDIKLYGLLGLSLGLHSVIKIILYSTLIGSIIAIFLVLFKIKKYNDSIPFGPFIAAGFFLSLII